ncbi:PepSY-associated TM helix domain-containing protein [Chenggangzhangella methanolivorans]|uniref:PepSY domain-containing protein n=1 Tax=Chenggangzhangella methanolivorans TaxID=1437009 RepID=A0A9E6UPU2_9HYPH|nr:PepSY domain-containing protein [Chenggangzhangella methanolivorans]QZO00140.1 PepSY domain-containing protein [Chenggangzhangella methanolivorans]
MGFFQNPALYRAVWRWHFYAGLIVAPFLLILSVTGAIYLFNDEINDALHADKRIVAPHETTLPLGRLVAAAAASVPGGEATRIDTWAGADRSAQVYVKDGQGGERRVFVDPGTGAVLGSYVYDRTLVGFADRFHGSSLLGGHAIVELAACWGVVLIVTGLYLWWPRGARRFADALVPKLRGTGRPFWKSLHAAIGVWTAAVLLFLILTGLPWANVWGTLLRAGTEAAGIGYPVSHRNHGAVPASAETMKQATGEAPWTLETAPMPASREQAGDEHAGHHGGHMSAPADAAAAPIGVDRAGEILAAAGMAHPYRLSLPKGAAGVYSAYVYPDRPQGQRTIQIDQYSGAILNDVGFADYGVAAKAVELGVQLHMGNYFGRANQFVMLLACVGTAALSITGPIMWWRRRPKGQLAAPRTLEPTRLRTVATITLVIGILFPLAGLSLVAALGVDRLMARRGAGG